MELLSVDKSHPILYVPDVVLMKHLFENIYICTKNGFTEEALIAMSGELLRFMTNVRLNLAEPPQGVNLDYGNLSDTMNFMREHLNSKLNYGDLVCYSNQSKSQLFRHFKDRTGQSPIEFFINLKMEKACELLEGTDMHIKDIAERLGYDDPYYFSRVFKKIVGQSPSEHKNSRQHDPIVGFVD